MAGRIIIPNFPSKLGKFRKNSSRVSQIPSASRELSKRRISNYDIKEILTKSPRREIASPYSSNIMKNERSSFTPNYSPINHNNFYFPHRQKSVSRQSNKLTIGLMPTRTKENLRYKSQSLEESESYKNLNGVSTPPEEEIMELRTLSPFSEIIDDQIRRYIESPAGKLGKMKLSRYSGFIEDSGTYSTNESRKKISSKLLKGIGSKDSKAKSPKSVSIFSKLHSGKFNKLRSRRYK